VHSPEVIFLNPIPYVRSRQAPARAGRPRLAATIVVATLAAVLALPALASAQGFAPVARPEVGIEDQNVTFGPAAPQILAQWRDMGVDSVRIQAYWDALSPGSKSARRPAGFNPANPNDPQYQWALLDRAISLVRMNGMRVNLTINQCNPRWASTQPRNSTHCWRPSPRLFAQFVNAVGRRYGGVVDRYLLGSEPNQRQFLAPQFVCRGRRCVAESPHRYRDLVRAGYPALKRADRGSTVLIGELAPIGSPPSRRGGMKPLAFMREMGCVDRRFRPVRTGSCRRFRAATGDAFGYHPYVNNRKAPTAPNRDPDIAKIGDLRKLMTTIDRLSTKRRIRPSRGRRFAMYFTEYGYISNPPSRKFGVSLARQALYNSQSAYIVWKNRGRIKLLSQYLWTDDATFATGLILRNGRAKPSLHQFPHPFFIEGTLRRARFWGQVRPDANRQVLLQERARGARDFRTVRTPTTDPGGYWTLMMRPRRGALYRFVYVKDGVMVPSATLGAPRR
jgi:hypothetical protein